MTRIFFFCVIASWAFLATAMLSTIALSASMDWNTNCGEQGSVTLTLNQPIPPDTVNMKDIMASKIEDIDQAAGKVGADYKITMKNYDVIPVRGEEGNLLHANIIFFVRPADKAYNIMNVLNKKQGYVARSEIRTYNSPNCPSVLPR